MGMEFAQLSLSNLFSKFRRTRREEKGSEYTYVISMLGNTVTSVCQDGDELHSTGFSAEVNAPTSILLSKDGKSLYVASLMNDMISAFRVEADGTLTRLNSRHSDRGPESMALCQRGRFLYVANSCGGSLSVFPIDSEGHLGYPTSVATDDGARQVAVHPNNDLLCVCHRVGTLTFLTVSPLGEVHEVATSLAGSNPVATRWSADGRHLFVLNGGLGISVWRNDTADKWNKVGFFPTGPGASDFVLSPTGDYLYVTRDKDDKLEVYGVEGGRLEFQQSMSCLAGPKTPSLNTNGDSLRLVCAFDQRVSSFQIRKDGMLNSPTTLRAVGAPVALTC
jgi:6-phosphogluconolactonase (cycloisomerase 2 family)